MPFLNNMSTPANDVSNNSQLIPTNYLQDPINAAQMQDIRSFFLSFCICSSFLGMVTNSLNVVTFYKMGITDVGNMIFFGLSVCDFGNTICLLTSNLAMAALFLKAKEPFFYFFDPYIVYCFVVNSAIALYYGSAFLTTYMAIMRCCCVALPFRVRSIFTKKQAVVVIAITGMLLFSLLTVNAMAYSTKTMTAPASNRTVIRVSPLPLSDWMLDDLVPYVLMPLSSYVFPFLVSLCVAVTVICLKRSTEFKSKATRSNYQETDSNKNPGASTDASATVKKQDRVSELQLIKAVIAVCIIYVVSTIPGTIFFTVRIFEKEFDAFGELRSWYRLTLDFKLLSESLNSSVNMFVYLNMNSKFRATFWSLFCCKNKQPAQS